MTEKEFWTRLMFRLCGEFNGIPELKSIRMWCDGFLPRDYLVTGRRPRIVGRVYLYSDDRRTEDEGDVEMESNRHPRYWEFTLRIPKRIRSKKEIDWASLLPPNNVTKWVSIDFERLHLTLEPGAAVPDLPE